MHRAVSGLPRRIPAWAFLLFVAGFGLALSPNLLHLYGIHNDYEMLIFKNHGLLHHEADHLFAIARPLAALLCNLPLLPVETLGDYRWTRLFSTATVCLLGYQLISICVHHLRTSALQGAVVALVTFLVPAFIYSVLNATAWGTHLVPLFIAFVAYEILARANVRAIPFIGIAARREWGALWHQALAYARLPEVWRASLVLQLAFYNFPPSALVLTLLPVVGVLFSRLPPAYRTTIALRDVAFVGLNVAIYVVSAKLVYIPIVGQLVSRTVTGESRPTQQFDERTASSYTYKINTDIGEILGRLENLVRVVGDLWFLPQTRLHVVAIAVMLAAILVVVLRNLQSVRRGEASAKLGVLAVAIVGVCFLLSAVAVLGASGGFISYRTVPVTTALTAVVFLGAIRVIGEMAGRIAVAVALVATAGAAVAGNFELNYLTMKLARNETAYFQSIIQKTRDERTDVLFLIDPRTFSLPEDNAVQVDQHGRAIPPYELGCLSSICLQNGAIVTILAEERGIPRKQLRVYPVSGADPVAGITCDLLKSPTLVAPPGASEAAVATIKFWRSLAPFTCVSFSLDWHDLGP